MERIPCDKDLLFFYFNKDIFQKQLLRIRFKVSMIRFVAIH